MSFKVREFKVKDRGQVGRGTIYTKHTWSVSNNMHKYCTMQCPANQTQYQQFPQPTSASNINLHIFSVRAKPGISFFLVGQTYKASLVFTFLRDMTYKVLTYVKKNNNKQDVNNKAELRGYKRRWVENQGLKNWQKFKMNRTWGPVQAVTICCSFNQITKRKENKQTKHLLKKIGHYQLTFNK